MTVNTTTKVGVPEDHHLPPRWLDYSPPLCHLPTELGSGPFSLISAVSNDTILGVNRTSNTVIPLARGHRLGQFPPPGMLFNFMITAGLQKDRTSRECL